MDRTDFSRALANLYATTPGQVLPNALWKTQRELEHLKTSMLRDNDIITHLEARDDTRLLVYWTRDRHCAPNLNGVEFALLHDDYLAYTNTDSFANQRYFRLTCDVQPLPSNLPSGFQFAPVNVHSECDDVVAFINACYESIRVDADTVTQWTHTSVYAPDLWFWIIDNSISEPAALGIAAQDRSIGELSLEWIQVIPTHRGQGLGKALVIELLHRGLAQASFATVAGEVAASTNPERFYRACGFTGDDVWSVLRRITD